MMIFIERRICRLLDRREKSDRKRRRIAPSLSVDDTQNPDDETTAGGAMSCLPGWAKMWAFLG
jgi:hypothetical protein